MSTLAQMILFDIYSNLPTAGIPGRLFYVTSASVTNAGNLYRDNGTSWQLLGPYVSGTLSFDTAPASPNAANDEFEGASLAAVWNVTANTADATSYNSITPSSLWIKHTDNHTYSMSKSFVPGASDFAVTAKVYASPTSNYQYMQVILGDTQGDVYASPGSSNAVMATFSWSTTCGVAVHKNISGSTTYGTQITVPVGMSRVYFHVQRVSGTWSVWWSTNGVSFFPYTGWTPSAPTVSYVTFTANQNTSTTHAIYAIDYLRFNLFFL